MRYKYFNKFEKLKILSFGGGVQTVTLAAMCALGDYERPDALVFADTGWETTTTYEYLIWFRQWLKEHGMGIITRTQGNIRKDALSVNHRFASMPLYTTAKDGSKGILRRQCTNEYKIKVVVRTIREIIGLRRNEHLKTPIDMWLGISCDEVIRMKPSQMPMFTNIYPLIDLEYFRKTGEKNCIDYLKSNNIPIPPRSACIGCPYHSDDSWIELKRDNPKDFEDACEFDELIRNRIQKKTESYGQVFLHNSRKPLREVEFGNQMTLFGEECEGYCGL